VDLIAAGATNRAVAQKLHLFPHTVKSHVDVACGHAFVELDIASRAQLRQLMRGAGSSAVIGSMTCAGLQ
jgi:DNA-binding NarL/FixJ family response regulator